MLSHLLSEETPVEAGHSAQMISLLCTCTFIAYMNISPTEPLHTISEAPFVFAVSDTFVTAYNKMCTPSNNGYLLRRRSLCCWRSTCSDWRHSAADFYRNCSQHRNWVNLIQHNTQYKKLVILAHQSEIAVHCSFASLAHKPA